LIGNLVDISKKLKEAKKTETALTAGTTAIEVASIGTISAAKIGAAAAEEVANKTLTASATELMAAETTAAYASIPFIGAGLATAQIAAMQALIIAAGVPKFADGGIIGGNSYVGDKLLIAANSGELILNNSQQSTLFGMLNGKSNTQIPSQNVIFRINGSELVGVFDNYNKKKSKVK